MTLDIKFKYIGDFKPPQIQTDGAAGIDLFNNSNNGVTIEPGEVKEVSTGFFVEIPKGYVGLIFARSSLGFKYNCTLINSVGVIDSDYRGEIKAKIVNLGKITHTIGEGERCVQLVIVPHIQANFIQVDKLSETDRGTAGFGSTGK